MALQDILTHFGFSVDKGNLDAADKGVEKVKGHAEESAKGVGLLVEAFQVLAGLELVRLTKEWVSELASFGDELGDTAEATGLSTRELQIWQLGAAQSGESAEVFTMALRKLSTAIAGGNSEVGTQAALFAKLGIKTKDAAGTTRNLADILPEIAEHFKNTADGAGKSALAQELFGRSGTKLIPLLNKGADGVAELGKQFDNLGGGFSTEAIERAGEMKESIANVNLVFTSLKSQLAIAILPRVQTFLGYLENAVGWLTEFGKETTLAESAVGSLSTALALTLGAAMFPYIGGALKFAAIYLAVDDLKGFLEGQDSEIGAILDAWFGDGTASVVREWCLDAGSEFMNFFDDMKTTVPLWVNTFLGAMQEIDIAFEGMVIGLEEKWNNLIGGLGLNDRFKIDTSGMQANLAGDTAHRDRLTTERQGLEARQTKYQTAVAAGAADVASAPKAYAPFNTAATQAPTQTWNMVQNIPQIVFNVPPGTPQTQLEAIGRQTRQVTKDTHRAALQALESRGGK